MSTIERVIPIEETKDRIIWAPSSFDMFSYRSFTRSITRVSLVSDRWKTLWDMSVQLKVKCFVWLFF